MTAEAEKFAFSMIFIILCSFQDLIHANWMIRNARKSMFASKLKGIQSKIRIRQTKTTFCQEK